MKKSYPCMLLLGLAALPLAADAQTDVTSKYLKNADFEGEYSVQTEYYKDNAGNHRAVYKPADWEMTYENGDSYDFSVLKSGDLQYSSIEKNAGGTLDATRFGSQTYRLRFRWGSKESIDLHQKVLLPAGAYKLSADVFGNTNGKMYIYAGTTKSTENVTSSKWTNVSISFTSNGTDSITIGVAFPRSKDEQINGVDNFKLLFSVAEKTALTKAITSATTANKTLNNTDLANAITKAQAVADNADATQTEVDEAAAFVTNMVSFAKALTLTTETLPYASADKLTAFENSQKVDAPTTAADALTKANAIYSALRAYVESNSVAEGVSGAESYTESIMNPNAESADGWTLNQGDGGGSISIKKAASAEPLTDADGNSSYNYFDGGNWNSADWTTRYQQDVVGLPAGKYILAVAARGSNNLRWLKLYGGNKEADISHIGADSNTGVFDRGWNDTYLVFTANGDDDVTIGVTANAQKKEQWHSFTRFRLTRIGDLDKVTLSEDGTEAPAASSDYQDVVLSRTFNANAWNTLILPFDVSAETVTSVFGSNAKVATFTGVTTSEGNYTLSFATSTEGIKANTLVLIYGVDSKSEFTFSSVKMKPTASLAVTADGVSFTGSYTTATLPAGSFYLSSDNNFYKANGSEQAKGTRAYFTLPDASAAKSVTLTVNGKTTTGIGLINVDEAQSEKVFNLAGKRVDKTAKGIVIVGGKKIIRK